MFVWFAFLLFVAILLALDLGVFHRKAHVVSVREALGWTVVWMLTALGFAVFVYYGYEHHWLGLGLTPDPVDRAPGFPEGQLNDARSALLKFITRVSCLIFCPGAVALTYEPRLYVCSQRPNI